MHSNSHFIITGDLNLPNWENHEAVSKDCILRQNCFSMLNLSQLNNIRNFNDKVLDLIFSDFSSTTVSKANNPLINIDQYHPTLEIEIATNDTYYDITNSKSIAYNYKLGNYEAMFHYLSKINWCILSNMNLNTAVDYYHNALHSAIDMYVPKIILKSTHKYPIWFSNEVKRAISDKKKAHIQYKNSQHDYLIFSEKRTSTKRLIKECFNKYVKDLEKSTSSNINAYWKHVNSLRSDTGLPKTMFLDHDTGEDEQTVANLFAKFFADVYESPENLNFNKTFNLTVDLSDCYISVTDVQNKLKLLEQNYSPGPDGIPPELLKICSDIISLPI